MQNKEQTTENSLATPWLEKRRNAERNTGTVDDSEFFFLLQEMEYK